MLFLTTSEGGEKRMKKGIVLFLVGLLLSISAVNAIAQPSIISKKTTTILCYVDDTRIEKEMSISTIQNLIDMGASCKKDFLTIYDKTKSVEDVTVAFENIKPFFQALKESGLTDKTVEELNAVYYSIREKIKEPKHKLAWNQQQGRQPAGIWNGFPTPVWANAICGIFDVGMCMGFAGGTHALIPTIGIDAFITYAFQGESLTVGIFGGTMAVAAFQVIIGFIGILICLPLIMFGPYFMTGLCGFVFGLGA
jgi:hypothetical protein